MIGLILAAIVPLAGIAIVAVFLFTPNPTKPGTSTKPEGGDPRRERRPQ